MTFSWVRKLTFRHACALFLAYAAFECLKIDSEILARGAGRWALSEKDRLAYETFAYLIPWIIALTPFAIALLWKTGHRLWAGAGLALYLVFIGYNAVGAGGAVAMIRSDVVSARKFDASRDRDRTTERKQLVEQRDAIHPKPRPVAALTPLLAAEKAKPLWLNSGSCKQPDGRSERNFCANVTKLEAEIGSSQALDKINDKIASIDGKTAVAGWVAEVVDPQAETWAQATGLPVEMVQKLLPLQNPIAIMTGSLILLGLAIAVAGLNHEDIMFGSRSGVASAAKTGGGGEPAPVLTAASPKASAAASQFVTQWFAEHTRPVNQGALLEEQWYAHYTAQCALSGIVPVPLQVFRAEAEKHGAKITEIDGRFYYQRIMPLVEAA